MVQFSHNGLSKLDSVFSPIQTIRQLSVDTTPLYWDLGHLEQWGNMITQWQGGQGGVTRGSLEMKQFITVSAFNTLTREEQINALKM